MCAYVNFVKHCLNVVVLAIYHCDGFRCGIGRHSDHAVRGISVSREIRSPVGQGHGTVCSADECVSACSSSLLDRY